MLVQEACGLGQLVPAAHTEAEVIEPHTILVKAVPLRRDGTQPQEQGALDQDDAAKEDRVDGTASYEGSLGGGISAATSKPSRFV
jgi:hypothetical protein